MIFVQRKKSKFFLLKRFHFRFEYNRFVCSVLKLYLEKKEHKYSKYILYFEKNARSFQFKAEEDHKEKGKESNHTNQMIKPLNWIYKNFMKN